MILKVQGPNRDQVSTRDNFQIWVKLEGPKTYFSLIKILPRIFQIYVKKLLLCF